ncbi:protein TolR [Halotalea alkalilenta]|uniref:Tol-Pal system protein TolR n=1 Tax=Halotalea alkalilenta TaxID=376489 RepID=A0A172YFB2_9GAMM|nr:protein TolR [Halotalea alkalilenta]ANF57960.1 protein TolR [Halotalea alkalilenta]
MYGPFSRRGKRKLSSEINVVPFIDVMLVLLVIFMITAPMMNQGVEVELPQASAEPIDSDTPPLIVSVDSNGEYYMSRDGDNTPVSLESLGAQVQSVLAEQPQTPVMVRGDRNVSYGQVITLMATLQSAGVPNVGLVSEPGSGN